MGYLDEKIAVRGPLMQQALQAVHRYDEASGVKPAAEVEGLRLEAIALMIALSKYQFLALGGPAGTLH